MKSKYIWGVIIHALVFDVQPPTIAKANLIDDMVGQALLETFDGGNGGNTQE